MIIPASMLLTEASWNKVVGKYAIFKAKNQVALFWAEEAKIIECTSKTVFCSHPVDSQVYKIGSGRVYNKKPVIHRKSSIVAVCDLSCEVKQLALLSSYVVNNHLLLQALAYACPNKSKDLLNFLIQQEGNVYSQIEKIKKG